MLLGSYEKKIYRIPRGRSASGTVRIERNKYTPEEIKGLRQENAYPIIRKLEQWLLDNLIERSIRPLTVLEHKDIKDYSSLLPWNWKNECEKKQVDILPDYQKISWKELAEKLHLSALTGKPL